MLLPRCLVCIAEMLMKKSIFPSFLVHILFDKDHDKYKDKVVELIIMFFYRNSKN